MPITTEPYESDDDFEFRDASTVRIITVHGIKIKVNKSGVATVIRDKPHLSILKLPDAVLLRIFSFVKHRDLLNLTLVRRSWNELVSGSPQFLDKTLLTIKPLSDVENSRYSDEVLQIQRSYWNIEISSQIDTQMLDKLAQIGAHVKSLSMYGVKLTERNFVRMMLSMPNLQHCNFRFLKVHGADAAGGDQSTSGLTVKMRNLRTLKAYSCHKVLKHIRCSELDELCVEHPDRILGSSSDHIVDFLNQLDKLKVLDTTNLLFRSYKNSPKLKPKFTLQHLDIYYENIAMDFQYSTLKERVQNIENITMSSRAWAVLLRSMGDDSLVSIEILHPCDAVTELIGMCLNNQKITKLAFALDQLQKPAQVDYGKMRKAQHVKSLKLVVEVDKDELFTPTNCYVANSFIELFPSLTALNINSPCVKRISPRTLYNVTRKLKELEMDAQSFTDFVHYETNQPMSMAHLETLTINDIFTRDMEKMKKLVERQKKLKHIKLGIRRDLVPWAEYFIFTLFLHVKKFAWAEVKSYKTSEVVRKTKFEVELQQFGRLLTHAERKNI